MKIKSPAITSLGVKKLSANQIHLTWDSVGKNFYYLVEMAKTRDVNGVEISKDKLIWTDLGNTPISEWFEDKQVSKNTHYMFRVRSTALGFTPSDWVYTEELLTFKTNAYSITKDRALQLSNSFIERHLVNNEKSYIDFNKTQLWASLMSETFVYSPVITNLSAVRNHVLYEEEYHEIVGGIEAVCFNKDHTYVAYMDGLLYLMERYQGMVKVSNDKGQTWYYYQAMNDRVGKPVYRSVVAQNRTTSFILGYDKIFYARLSTDLRWSADDVRWSEIDISFTKLPEDTSLPFTAHAFTLFAQIPADIRKYAEAMTVSDDYLYVAGRNTLRFLDLTKGVVESDPESPYFGERIFDKAQIKVVPHNDKVVVAKMETVEGVLYALVTGELKEEGLDAAEPINVVPSVDAGIYKFDQKKLEFKRIFGNTDEELRLVVHNETSISTNGSKLVMSYTNFKHDKFAPLKYDGNNPNVESTLYAQDDQMFLLHRGRIMGALSFYNDSEEYAIESLGYYAGPWFNWMGKTKHRVWINNDDKIVIVHPYTFYSKVIDSAPPGGDTRIVAEHTDKGAITFNCANIEFSGFKNYAGGVLIHDQYGEIVGHYSLNYRARNELDIVWRPKHVMMVAELRNQEHPVEWEPETGDVMRSPDLRPLVDRMGPDSYILDNTNFKEFIKYYLQFLSDGHTTSYDKLLHLIKNKYPREEHCVEYLWSEINRRNIYLDKEKKDQVVRFFETFKSSFYSSKGVEASYKFLFKLLYNEDVEIETESSAGLEYDIYVDSDNINQDIVGRSTHTKTGRCNVTYIERKYVDTKLVWVITIHNMIGKFHTGQEIVSDTTGFKGKILRSIRGKELMDNNIDYINRGRSYYTMKIRSSLPTSRYANDILRFVHPAGFGFIGITVLTMFINSGLSMKHTETIIDRLITYRFDSGAPTMWPDRTLVFDREGEPETDPVTGEIKYQLSNKAGEEFDVISKDDYNKENGFDGETSKTSDFTSREDYLNSMSPWDRRGAHSPLFDQSAASFASFRAISSLLIDSSHNAAMGYLKDNIGNPRDPVKPTQEKVDKGRYE